MLIRPPSRKKIRASYDGYRLAVTLALGAAAMVMVIFGLARSMMRPPRVEPKPGIQATSEYPEATLLPDELEPASLAQKLARVQDGSDFLAALLEPEVDALLEEVAGLDDKDIQVRARTDVTYESLVQWPPDYRATFLRQRGVLIELGERRGADPQSSAGFYGRLLDLYGRPIAFVVARDPRPAFPMGRHPTDRDLGAALNGAFLQIVLAENAEGERRPAPLLVAPGLEPAQAIPPAPGRDPQPLTEREFLLQRVQDQVPLAVTEQKLAYYFLLNEVHRLTDEAVSRRVDPNLGYANFVDNPEIVRGAYFRIPGTAIRLEETLMDEEKAGMSRVFEGQIVDRERRPISFVLTEDPRPAFDPREVSVRSGRPVTLEGAFLMNLAYQNRAGKFTATPLIVARRLIPRQAPAGGRLTWPASAALAALAAFCLVALGGLICVSVRARRLRSRHENMGEEEMFEIERVDLPHTEEKFDPDAYLATQRGSEETPDEQ